MIVNCYLASVSVNNTLLLLSVYQISPDIHSHLPEKSQSSTVGNNGAPTSVPLSLGHALCNRNKDSTGLCSVKEMLPNLRQRDSSLLSPQSSEPSHKKEIGMQ